MPTLSVALITYNQEAFVAEALHSLLTQDHPGFELVLADDASTDRTREVIEATLAAYPHPHIRVVRAYRPANGGVLNNVNGAMAACTGEVIVAAAGDDISEPTRLRVIEEAFLDPTVQLVCTNYQKVDVCGRPFGTPPPKPAGGRFRIAPTPASTGGPRFAGPRPLTVPPCSVISGRCRWVPMAKTTVTGSALCCGASSITTTDLCFGGDSMGPTSPIARRRAS